MGEFTTSDRGLKHYKPIEDTYGATVSVYESSAASAPHIWVSIDGKCHLSSSPTTHVGVSHGIASGAAFAHLTLEDAEALREALGAAIQGHYQTVAPDA